MGVKFHMISQVDAFGRRMLFDVPRAAYEVGNALYFPNGLTQRWQLRPLLESDTTTGSSVDTEMSLLARHYPGIGAVYYVVRLEPRRRRNTRDNVRAALRVLRRQRPECIEFAHTLSRLSAEFEASGAAPGA